MTGLLWIYIWARHDYWYKELLYSVCLVFNKWNNLYKLARSFTFIIFSFLASPLLIWRSLNTLDRLKVHPSQCFQLLGGDIFSARPTYQDQRTRWGCRRISCLNGSARLPLQLTRFRIAADRSPLHALDQLVSQVVTSVLWVFSPTATVVVSRYLLLLSISSTLWKPVHHKISDKILFCIESLRRETFCPPRN